MLVLVLVLVLGSARATRTSAILQTHVASQGKATLVRIVSTITKLIERHLRAAAASTSTSRNGPSR